MRTKTQAFTLIELLVVLAIVAVLAALLFPTLAEAKQSGDKTACLTHQHVISEAGLIYGQDYDDRFTIIDEAPVGVASSRTNRTWVQLLLPYANQFSIFRCPSDYGPREDDSILFDQDIVPGDLTSRYYSASKRSDTGLNYEALAPQVMVNGKWINVPRMYAEIDTPSTTLMFLDSVHAVDKHGNPSGGGSWLVDPPCRYAAFPGGQLVDLFAVPFYPGAPIRADLPWGPFGSSPYGGAWPWHHGKMNVARVDGSIKPLALSQLSSSCESVGIQGFVNNNYGFIWAAHQPSSP